MNTTDRPTAEALHEERRRRVADCNTLEGHVFVSLNRHPGAQLDDIDEEMYRAAIKPILSALWNRRMTTTDPRLWKLVFDIRNAAFRPKPAQVSEMVADALGLVAPVEARNVVTLPAQKLIAPTPKEEFDAATYRPDYQRLPADPREWKRGDFQVGREFYCAVTVAMRERRMPMQAAQEPELAP